MSHVTVQLSGTSSAERRHFADVNSNPQCFHSVASFSNQVHVHYLILSPQQLRAGRVGITTLTFLLRTLGQPTWRSQSSSLAWGSRAIPPPLAAVHAFPPRTGSLLDPWSPGQAAHPSAQPPLDKVEDLMPEGVDSRYLFFRP